MEIILLLLPLLAVILIIPPRTRRIGQRILWVWGVFFCIIGVYTLVTNPLAESLARNVGRTLPTAAVAGLLFYSRTVWTAPAK